ncbi:MAG: hypothetical protein FJW40_10700 [Acidobacteria bacterium]|nr:hypothetical protein [Acidobacteriota bacterium]
MAWALVALIVAATVANDLIVALGMRRHAPHVDLSPGPLARLFLALFRKRFVLASIACQAVSFFAFLALLRIADLSFAVPATAASYVIETLLARLVLGESVTPARWAGAALVAAGVALLAA